MKRALRDKRLDSGGNKGACKVRECRMVVNGWLREYGRGEAGVVKLRGSLSSAAPVRGKRPSYVLFTCGLTYS